MKKVSTRAAAQSRNISQQKLTIGLDLGDRNIWYCVWWMKLARFNGNSESVRVGKHCRKSSARCRAAGSHWKSGRIHPGSVACSGELGHEVTVANARKVRLIGESRKKDDSAGCAERWRGWPGSIPNCYIR